MSVVEISESPYLKTRIDHFVLHRGGYFLWINEKFDLKQ